MLRVRGLAMRTRRWLGLLGGSLLAVIAVTVVALPALVRHVAIERLHALTHRPVRIDRLSLNLLTGHVVIQGLHVAELGDGAPFADLDTLDLRLHLPSLLRGHIWIRDSVLRHPVVRVVRFGDRFNLSDLIERTGATSGPLDITIDRFALHGGRLTLEDRASPENKTWASEQIEIEAANVSTRGDDGRVVGTSVTVGAPTSVQVEHFRLYPIHLQATLTAKGVDLAPGRLYLPPDSPVMLDQGRASGTLHVVFDARAGLRADATGDVENIALLKPGSRDQVAHVAKLTTQLSDFVYEDGRVAVGRFDLAASASVLNPAARPARLESSTVRASLADLTWPVSTPGRLALTSTVPGGGTLALTGMLRPPPAASQLELRLAKVQIAPWTRFLTLAGRVEGVAEADLRIDEPLRPGVPSRVRGTIAVNALRVQDKRGEIARVPRVQATGLEVHWPTRLAVKQVLVSQPRVTVERDQAGDFPALDLWRGSPGGNGLAPGSNDSASDGQRSTTTPAVTPSPARAGGTGPLPGVEIGALVVRDGALAWRDAMRTPLAVLNFSRIETTVTGVSWPLNGTLGVRMALHPPGGGRVQATGQFGIDPLTADLRLAVSEAEIGPYRPYAPTTARFSGRADLDVEVRYATTADPPIVVRGSGGLSQVDVRDEQREVMTLEQLAATGIDVQWPRRVSVRQLAVRRPWVLVERDAAGALVERALLTRGPGPRRLDAGGAPSAVTEAGSGEPLAIALGQLVVEGGGARVVDRRISPPFALDVDRVQLRADDLSTAPGKIARLDLTLQPGAGSELAVHGTVGPLRSRFGVNVTGDLRAFPVPRANPYLLGQIGWEAVEGQLATHFQCRIDGEALDARTEIRVSVLQLARGTGDEAQRRIGLPLGLLVGLLKNREGDINLVLPIGGRLNDPRFDFREAAWSALRNVAVKTIAAPVSSIGQIHYGDDSRIERIEVNPVVFVAGTATLTPESQEQVGRVIAFLQQTPEMRMALTPIVAAADVAELKRRALDAEIARVTGQPRIGADEAMQRLFKSRFPDRPVPDALGPMRTALLETETIQPLATSELAAQRLEAVRTMMKRAGIDAARLPHKGEVVDGQRDVEGQVALDLVQPEILPRRPGQRREFLGLTLPGSRTP